MWSTVSEFLNGAEESNIHYVLDDPNWNASSYSRLDAKVAGDQNPFNIQTWNGDLSTFKNKRGKILTYHGQADYIITSDNSPRY